MSKLKESIELLKEATKSIKDPGELEKLDQALTKIKEQEAEEAALAAKQAETDAKIDEMRKKIFNDPLPPNHSQEEQGSATPKPKTIEQCIDDVVKQRKKEQQ